MAVTEKLVILRLIMEVNNRLKNKNQEEQW